MSVAFVSTLEIMQLHAAGLISTRTAIERLGVVEDVDKELRRLEDERFQAKP